MHHYPTIPNTKQSEVALVTSSQSQAAPSHRRKYGETPNINTEERKGPGEEGGMMIWNGARISLGFG
ncbi:hypothetical protein FA13DRAFT_1734318 [Coprinellus micaceus]|uniref:Uncharacterized protein n=1 Tax=Coprinellus micaceus TaxID=71717 RepID=A0A4Y7T753_COPMI|nr:hypothetical protein FA13DRAFT_1734318 [Coprinellus micaceus]